jgi:hypothetical protein
MRIETVEIRNRGIFDAWHNGELICDQTRTPLCSAARVLLRRGADPTEILEKVSCGSDQVNMRMTIGVAAKLSVYETPSGPKFKPFKDRDADDDQPSPL